MPASRECAGDPERHLAVCRARLPDPAATACELPRGAGIVLRDYDLPDRLPLATELLKISKMRGLRLLIGGDPKLANKVGANGVHWPEVLLPEAGTHVRPPGWIVTAAAHCKDSLHRAFRIGADAAFLSPAFATDSHPADQPLGPMQVASLTHSAELPVIALGGITTINASLLRGTGVIGIAAISALGLNA